MTLTSRDDVKLVSQAVETRVPCSRDTREQIRSCKRGGESYDSVLQKMVEQYDPAEAADTTQNDARD
jgi:hypothetical protein